MTDRVVSSLHSASSSLCCSLRRLARRKLSGEFDYARAALGSLIVHITTRSAWELARASGRYEPQSLAVDGFIHFSGVEQVVAVANAAFSGQGDLVLLCVAVGRLDAPLRYESSDAGGESFPHVYGAVNLDAVVAVVPFVEDHDGFAVPAEVARNDG